MEIKNTNENDLEHLVYKTMPKVGKGINVVPLATPAVFEAPLVPVPKPPTPVSPGSTARPNPVPNLQPVAPVPPVSMTKADLVDHEQDDSFGLSHSPKKSNLNKILFIVLLLLLIVGGGVFAYFKLKKSSTPAVTSSPMSAGTVAVTSVISDEWRLKYFGSKKCADLSICGDDADPDHDGLTNAQEFRALTDPNNPDSDKDGLADGDEVNIFHFNPQNADTSGKPQYDDATELKLKYNPLTSKPFTDDELKTIAANIVKYGLHEPTITTLGPDLVNLYTNYGKAPSQSSTNAPVADAGSLDRDIQRADTIKQIGYALLQYKQTNPKYPLASNFDDMIKVIKPLIQSKAINTSDPKNVAPLVYSYAPVSGGSDFKLGYYSETQNQAVIMNAKSVTASFSKDQALQRDTKRKTDLETVAALLENYSTDNANPNTPNEKIYPDQISWKTALSPKYITAVPTDPQTNQDYIYTVSQNKDSYALQSNLEIPPTGKKGYACTGQGCSYY
ncbi:MAG: hypothetical protein NVSMB66_2250 [Candidatus Doudnabacteria bacterium]